MKIKYWVLSFLLSFDTNGFSSSACGLSMLTSDFESPFVSNTLVTSDFVQSFDVFSQFGLEDVRSDLEIFAFFVISLSVQEPSGDSVSFGIVNDVGNTVALSFSEFTGSDGWVDSQNFADEESKSSADTFDFVKSVGYGSFTIDVGVQNTMNMFEVVLSVFNDE
jgi:hypothetical protein